MCGKAFLLTQQPHEQVFGADMLVRERISFLGRVGKSTSAFVAEGQVNRGRGWRSSHGVLLDLLANTAESFAAQESCGQRLVFAQQAEQKMLGLNVGTAELRCLITAKEDDAPGFLGESLKHGTASNLNCGNYRYLMGAVRATEKAAARSDDLQAAISPVG